MLSIIPPEKLPARATTRFGASWPCYNKPDTIRLDKDAEVCALHGAADQDGWDGGVVCLTPAGKAVIDENALKIKLITSKK